jgi:hypothetical protein
MHTILYDDDEIAIILQPTFSNKSDKNEWPIEIEYGSLPNYVKKEVIKFLQSDQFIIDQVEEYALNEMSEDIYKSQPVYNTRICDIRFEVINNILSVYLYGKLIKTNAGKSFIYKDLTLNKYEEYSKEGFYKASHSGSLVQVKLKYLGDQGYGTGRYSIYLNYDRITVYKL